ncbi:MAG: hypothetical protein R6U10_02130 [Thermoplasmatota archaeon]
MPVTVPEKDVKQFEKLKLLSYIIPTKEKIRFFEEKYGVTLDVFEDEIEGKEEDFEQWDDYIEWKAYVERLDELKKKRDDIEHATHFRIA